MDTFVDTTSISLISPQKKEKLKIEENKIIPIYLSFSSLIDTANSNSNFSIFQDSVLVEYDAEWINPLSAKIFPKDNWIPDKDYFINIPQESIVPLYRKIFKDSVYTISLKSSSYQKYGSLIINPGIDHSNDLKVELKMLGNEGVFLKNNLNSDKLFRLENILEGQYLLMFFQDNNKDNQISSGVISPYQPSEWFYYYPDTLYIRSNWELELNEKKINVNTENFQTNKDGIFAVGDINDYPGKLDLILCGFHETTLAVQEAYRRIHPGERVPFGYTTSNTKLQKKLGVAE